MSISRIVSCIRQPDGTIHAKVRTIFGEFDEFFYPVKNSIHQLTTTDARKVVMRRLAIMEGCCIQKAS